MLTELCRLGADAELKYTPNGDAVAELRLAYDVRVKNETVTQWVTASLWGKRAESAAQHLTKGKQLFITMESPYVRKWDKGDGYSLVSRVIDFKFAGGGKDQSDQQHSQSVQEQFANRQPNRAPNPYNPQAGFAGQDDDIPF